MTITPITPRISLNKSFLKVKPNRDDIEKFKTNLTELLDQIDERESEEFHKNIISKFFDKTYYGGNHYINTKGRNDLVIHVEKIPQSDVGVIIETKKPTNKNEMLRKDNLNAKAFHELILYYLRERVKHRNISIKYLIVTNIYEWFIFDAQIFEKAFAEDASLIKQFNEFEEKRLLGTNTDFFYKSIAEPAVQKLISGNSKAGKEIQFTYFDIREFEKILRNKNKEDDIHLIALFKLLSPEHLLKLPFKNDSNSLDKGFYNELLHIIGLTEIKQGTKKLIGRKEGNQRDDGSLLENTIAQLEVLDKLSRLSKPSQFGKTNSERYFNVGLELVITWINRILFLKLLEAQLLSYHKGDKSYAFLNISRITNFDHLNSLFFQVLAKKASDRNASNKAAYSKIPYLNSSLFDPTEIEHDCLFISQLPDNVQIPILSSTVLKDNAGKKMIGTLSCLEYLFLFLDAYDFSSEGSEEIQEENKALISASVLGLIFEKINGYKDGSFFTPGFITMYMCREIIRNAVIQKFNKVKQWNCNNIDDLYNKIEDKREANSIINSIKICDPAVGSGHFLVSALNEIIALKSYLKILLDRDGKVLRDYHLDVSNDELAITDVEGKLFEYNPRNKESQRIQEALFHEKQAIIEDCLFGVDINDNSIKICHLRLWIELLKSAYYKTDNNIQDLETLPNIDINIKPGNSIISRFPLDADLSQTLKKSSVSIQAYRQAVIKYRHAETKDQKREMLHLITLIKSNFRTDISNNDPIIKKLSSKRGELDKLVNQHNLFELSKIEKREKKQTEEKLRTDVKKLEDEINAIKTNKLFENAFEWRFEFPEVLDDQGNFLGFDIVIGNPPYLPLESFPESERNLLRMKYPQFERKFETSVVFMVKGFQILAANGHLSFIAPATWQTGENYSKFRKFIIQEKGISKIINLPFDTFEDAYVDTSIYFLNTYQSDEYGIFNFDKKDKTTKLESLPFSNISISEIASPNYKLILDKVVGGLLSKYSSDKFISLGAVTKSTQGLSGSQFPEMKGNLEAENSFPFLAKGNVYNFSIVKEKIYITDLTDKKSLKHFYAAEPKLLIRRIINRQDRLSVGYTDEKIVFKKDINPFIVTDDRIDTKYLLGILTSRFISYLYLNMSSIAKKDDFRQTTLAELRKLPIPLVSKDIQTPIINLVDEILLKKSSNPDTDTSALEAQIDKLVYTLYEVSPKEIEA